MVNIVDDEREKKNLVVKQRITCNNIKPTVLVFSLLLIAGLIYTSVPLHPVFAACPVLVITKLPKIRDWSGENGQE